MYPLLAQIEELTTDKIVLMAVIAGVAIVLLAVLLAVAMRLLRKPGQKKSDAHADLSIDVKSLGFKDPPPTNPRLEFYGTPVRLVVFVLAPAGRGVEVPPNEQLRETVEYLIPGLSQIIDLHHPVFRRWPLQLSSQGFTQAFFNKIALPGDHGKGTPWCSVAGKFEQTDGHLLAGFVCQAENANMLSEVTVEHAGKWHDVLRVRKEDA